MIVEPYELAAMMRELRHRQGWTQAKLAQRSGLSARTVMRVEAGGDASAATWRALWSALGVRVSVVEVTTESRDSVGTFADEDRPAA